MTVTLEMIYIPSGTFTMGSPQGELGRSSDEGPRHRVTVAEFSMGEYPITQAQWRAVASLPQVERELDPAPSRFKGDNRPVEQVNWHEAMEFCARLSADSQRQYTLPSEAQWEYACRAGTTTAFHFGDTITPRQANYEGNHTTPVDSFPPNSFGLYDMHGNVWEWCLDHFHDSYDGAPADGSAWVTGEDSIFRVLRGGSWSNAPESCRSAYRFNNDPVNRYYNTGFRVVSFV